MPIDAPKKRKMCGFSFILLLILRILGGGRLGYVCSRKRRVRGGGGGGGRRGVKTGHKFRGETAEKKTFLIKVGLVGKLHFADREKKTFFSSSSSSSSSPSLSRLEGGCSRAQSTFHIVKVFFWDKKKLMFLCVLKAGFF